MQNFSENRGFSIFFGIPINLLLYLLVWKLFSTKKAEIVEVKNSDGEVVDYEWHLSENNGLFDKLFKLCLLLFKIVSTLFFIVLIIVSVFLIPQNDIFLQSLLIFLSITLLIWTHYRFFNILYLKIFKKDNLLAVLAWVLIGFILWKVYLSFAM